MKGIIKSCNLVHIFINMDNFFTWCFKGEIRILFYDTDFRSFSLISQEKVTFLISDVISLFKILFCTFKKSVCN